MQIVEEVVECEEDEDPAAEPEAERTSDAPADIVKPSEASQAAAPDGFVADDAPDEAPARKTRTVTRTVPPPPPSREVEIGRIARELLLDGELHPDEYILALVVEAVRRIEAAYAGHQQAQEGAAAVGSNAVPQVPVAHVCMHPCV